MLVQKRCWRFPLIPNGLLNTRCIEALVACEKDMRQRQGASQIASILMLFVLNQFTRIGQIDSYALFPYWRNQNGRCNACRCQWIQIEYVRCRIRLVVMIRDINRWPQRENISSSRTHRKVGYLGYECMGELEGNHRRLQFCHYKDF